MTGDRRSFFSQTLGPGLLFAGAAVGVSHLVQSTRAGAAYGLSLFLVIVAANVIKYPAFAFGPRYAAATGTSLLEGYRRQGRWALVLYALLTVGTMFTVQAAVTLVTAVIAKALFHLTWTPLFISALLMALCAVLLVIGHYRWLDRLIKLVVALLTVLTLTATVLVLPRVHWSVSGMWPGAEGWNWLFVAALVGWMPSAIDIAVWHSLWTLAKRRDTGYAPPVKEALLDFNIGYIGTAVLALCFLLLGAGVVHGSGAKIPASGAAFANMVIDLYVQTLGAWSRYLIGGAALMVMFSTTLTVVDGFPRALSALTQRFGGPEEPGAEIGPRERLYYWIAMALLAAGSLIILHQLAKHFTRLIDIATTISFLTAPMLAALNHRAVTGAEVPEADRPGPRLRLFSLICIGVLTAFAAVWIWVNYLSK